jgi:hypothetical protein
MPLTETEKALTYVLVPLGIIVFFIGMHLFMCWRNDRKEQRNYFKAVKPTRAEIAERNEIDRLLELDEYPTIVRQINLDQHEKAIS